MIKLQIKLHGHLYWYADKQKEILLETEEKIFKDILEEINVPIGEVSYIKVGNVTKGMDYIPTTGDFISVFPVVGGG